MTPLTAVRLVGYCVLIFLQDTDPMPKQTVRFSTGG